MLSKEQRSYIAGFLDGDGSIYAQLKPNLTYKFGFQVVTYAVLFQSKKNQVNFERLCSMINLGYMRLRKDGVLEYIIGKNKELKKFLEIVRPFVILKKQQVLLMDQILTKKEDIGRKKDFKFLMKLIDRFRDLNYSKKRKKRILTP